ncbi:MAG: phosphopantetheine-binding protein [bacterium]
MRNSHTLDKEGLHYRLLHISHAFHSPMMEPISKQFLSIMKKVNLNPPRIPYMSNVSGDWITEKEVTSPQYWVDQILSTVNFSSGISKFLKNERNVYLEVGPGTTLSTFVKDHDKKALTVSSLPHPKEQQCSMEYIMSTAGRMWVYGVQFDWKKFQGGGIRNKVELPGYPFERKRYWINPVTDDRREESLEIMKIDKYTEYAIDKTTKTQCSEKKIKPRNHLEEEVLQIFEYILGESEISVEDNFFKLGGHSLLAIQLLSKVNEKLNVQIKLKEFFKNPTVAGLAEEIEGLGSFSEVSAIKVYGLPEFIEDKENRFEPFPLTEMQQAQWLGRISSFNMGNVAAHIYVEMEKEDIDLDRLLRNG